MPLDCHGSSQLIESKVLVGVEAQILEPENAAIICSMGKGRMLDYAVASNIMAKLIKVKVDIEAPRSFTPRL